MPWTWISEWLSENVLVLVFLASLFGALSVVAGLLAGYVGHLEAVGAQIAAAKVNERAAVANERAAGLEKEAAELRTAAAWRIRLSGPRMLGGLVRSGGIANVAQWPRVEISV
jgi:hypothetical protein